MLNALIHISEARRRQEYNEEDEDDVDDDIKQVNMHACKYRRHIHTSTVPYTDRIYNCSCHTQIQVFAFFKCIQRCKITGNS